MKKKENGPNYDEESHAGCTANVCLITPDFIYVANAGDSRSVCCTLKGETKELSKDHKPEDKIETDRIKKAGGEVSFGRVNGNLNLSRALGDL
jgi:serine/threonine protein phosphatase PrpC